MNQPTDLVTPAAIDAAEAKDDHWRWNKPKLDTPFVTSLLNAAAPHIAAEALRQAAEHYADLDFGQWETGRVKGYLTARANEWERDA